MASKVFHAHPGGPQRRVVPPVNALWACPYGTQEAATEASTRFAGMATAFAYETLAELTTGQFSIGGDRPARVALAYLHEHLTGSTELVQAL